MPIKNRETLTGHFNVFKPNIMDALTLYKKNILKLSLFTIPQVYIFFYLFFSVTEGYNVVVNLYGLIALNIAISLTFIYNNHLLIKSDTHRYATYLPIQNKNYTQGFSFGLQHLTIAIIVFGALDVIAGNQLLDLLAIKREGLVITTPWHDVIVLFSYILAINTAFFSFLPSVFANMMYTFKDTSIKKSLLFASRMVFRERELLFFHTLIYGALLLLSIIIFYINSMILIVIYFGIFVIPFIICLNYVSSRQVVGSIEEAKVKRLKDV